MSLQRTIKRDQRKEDFPWDEAMCEQDQSLSQESPSFDARLSVLLLGSGGRESAMAYAIAKSPLCRSLFIAPGNGGTDLYGTNVDIDPNDFEALAAMITEQHINIVVVGPEEPLVRGIVDYFSYHPELSHIPIIGPSMEGAKLEGSKDFSKGFMLRHGIPTADYQSFRAGEETQGIDFLLSLQPPYVLKADGLAAGKGVEIIPTMAEAKESLKAILAGKFGSAGNTVLIEQYLSGIECSVFVATDGESYKILPIAKDYKRIGDGDTGLNTGGMGSVSPVPFADDVFMEKVEKRIIKPTVEGLKAEGIDYRGFIFFGLMNVNGDPYLIEYNCRLGDPEAEVVLPRIASDFLSMLLSIASRSLGTYDLKIDSRAATSVMLVSRGYPGPYEKGYEMTLPNPPDDVLLFHAGTTKKDGKVFTNGGRILAVTGYGSTSEAARRRAYTIATQVLFEGKNYRHDIGADLL